MHTLQHRQELLREVLNWIEDRIEGTSFYRSKRAKIYPEDSRNAGAVELLTRLQNEQHRDSDFNLERLCDLRRLAQSKNCISDLRVDEDQYFGRIGFDHFPESRTEMFRDLCYLYEAAILRSTDEAVAQ